MNNAPVFTEVTCIEALAEKATQLTSAALASAIELRGTASLVVSGGSTPQPFYRQLAGATLAWEHVMTGLVDERWVAPDDARSNERLVRKTLLQDEAAHAHFVAMHSPDASPFLAEDRIEALYARLPCPFDVVCLGMGVDGHTASWFPGAQGLDRVLDPASTRRIAAIDANGAAVAGDVPLRMTLTLAAIASARLAILLITGGTKRSVYEQAIEGGAAGELPVSTAIRALGNRLHVIWTP